MDHGVRNETPNIRVGQKRTSRGPRNRFRLFGVICRRIPQNDLLTPVTMMKLVNYRYALQSTTVSPAAYSATPHCGPTAGSATYPLGTAIFS
jgi:hypothetical protein